MCVGMAFFAISCSKSTTDEPAPPNPVPADKKVEIKGGTFTFTVSRSETTTIDKKALEADGLLEKYQKKSEQYRMSVK